jgi:hypothetical protein
MTHHDGQTTNPHPAVPAAGPHSQPVGGGMTPLTLPATGPNGTRILSAVRVGTSESPAEYIVVVDCREGTPTERYATLHVYAWPDQVKFRDGVYNLTWPQAKHSLAERAGLIAHRQVEVVIFAKEPYATDEISVFIDGEMISARDGLTIATPIFYLDEDDEDDDWIPRAITRAQSLSTAAAHLVTEVHTAIARERGIGVTHD